MEWCELSVYQKCGEDFRGEDIEGEDEDIDKWKKYYCCVLPGMLWYSVGPGVQVNRACWNKYKDQR